MKNRIPLVIAAVIIIVAILFAYLWISGIFPKENTTTEKPSDNVTPDLNNNSTRLKYFPPEIRGEVQSLAGKYSLALNIWGFDPINNEINIYADSISNESAINDLQKKQIGNYTIHIINYTEILNARDEVRSQLTELTQPQKDSEYQMGFISMMTDISSTPTRYYAELWAYNSTPENRKLDNMVIKGWKIQVYPMSPIHSNTGNTSKSR
ncbi:MAG: hypothetical protein M0Q91_11480 [Methanoregula sp.]|jgi:hypothetical protein|nr:hypothetical protein [Methanoregula sp.]